MESYEKANVRTILPEATVTLQQSFRLSSAIRQSLNGQDKLCKFFDQLMEEVSRVSDLVELVGGEEALKTMSVSSALQDVKKQGEELNMHLKYVESQLVSNRLEQIRDALVSRSDDKTDLQCTMEALALAKGELISCILIANVGLFRGIGNSVKVNTAMLERLDALVKSKLGIEKTLRMKVLVGGRQATGDGLVTLTADDIQDLAIDEPTEATTDAATARDATRTRNIRGNRSLGESLMINTPVSAQDIWKDIDEITIENNVSEDSSIMVNYPIPVDDLIKRVKARRGRESSD